MSDNKEDANEFEDQPEVQTAAEETAPTPEVEQKPSEVPEAVRRALQKQGTVQIQLAPCPCGTVNVNLVIELPQGSTHSPTSTPKVC